MTSIQTELEQLQSRIRQDKPETRYRFQPELRHLIGTMKKTGQKIPQKTKRLHDELLAEAIEAQFDNMPV